MIKGNAMVPKVCLAQTPKWRCRTNFRKEKPMKVLRVFFTVALFSAGVAVADDSGISIDPNGGTDGAPEVAVAGDKRRCVDPTSGVHGAASVAVAGDKGL